MTAELPPGRAQPPTIPPCPFCGWAGGQHSEICRVVLGAPAYRGWYRDGGPGGRLRYWDGRAWTWKTRTPGNVTIHVREPADPGHGVLMTLATGGLWAPVAMLRSGQRWRVKRNR